MILTSSKLPYVTESIFSKMSQMALDYKAINLSQGFPDFKTDPILIELVSKAMKKGHNQYAPLAGILPLRERIAEKTEKQYGSTYDVDSEITITNGASEALFSAITAFVQAGDEVIIFDPSYDLYAPTITLMGGNIRAMELHIEDDFKIDWDRFKKLLTAQTKMIIINSPQNPTGRLLNENDIQQLIKLTANTDVIILADDVYEHMIFDGKKHLSFSKYASLKERTMITGSFSKLTHTTGWKIGYCMGPKHLMKEFRKIHQFNVFCVNTPMQYALAEYFKDENNYLHLAALFQEKRDYLQKLLKESPFKILPCEGSYFQCIDYGHLSREKDIDIAKLLTINYGVATIPISVFYTKNLDQKVLRLCFAKDHETLEKASEKLINFKINP